MKKQEVYHHDTKEVKLFNHATCSFVTSCCKTFGTYRGSRAEVFCKKGVLKIFAKFTGKYL